MSDYSETEVSTAPRVNPDTFVAYLFGGTGFALREQIDNHPGKFAGEIDMGAQFAEVFRQMYAGQKTARDVGLNSENPDELVEQERVIFTNRLFGPINSTPSVYGDTLSVASSSLKGVLIAGNTPLLDVHQHHRPALFSPEDYTDILVGNPQTGMRILYGTVVLCPGHQLLALSTKDTPTFASYKEAQTYIEEYRESITNERNQVMNERTQDIDEKRQLAETVKSLLSNAEDATAQKLQILAKSTEEAYTKAWKERLDKFDQMDNASRIAFAKALGLKLYISTNMQHFKAFSA